MAEHFYNTIGAQPHQLELLNTKAKTQDKIIENHMRTNYNMWFTAEHLHEVLFTSRTPLTSIRRALTTLYKRGRIIKSEKADTQGQYGVMVHEWKYNGINIQKVG